MRVCNNWSIPPFVVDTFVVVLIIFHICPNLNIKTKLRNTGKVYYMHLVAHINIQIIYNIIVIQNINYIPAYLCNIRADFNVCNILITV